MKLAYRTFEITLDIGFCLTGRPHMQCEYSNFDNFTDPKLKCRYSRTMHILVLHLFFLLIFIRFFASGSAEVIVEPSKHRYQFPEYWPFETSKDVYYNEFEWLRLV